MVTSAPVERPSPWAPLRHRVFAALWVAQLASNVGTWMQNVGASWLMGDLDASPALVALVQTATTLPVLLVGIPAGALADIVDRRRLLLVTQGIMLAAALALALVTFADIVTPAGLLSLTFVLGLGSALNLPAWQAIQPELVPRKDFSQAVALGALAFNVGRAVGPALGGLVVSAAGPGWVFLLNALSFVAVIVVLARWRRPTLAERLPAESLAGAMRAGLRYGAHSPALTAVLVRAAAFAVPASAVLALLPVVVRGPLGLSSGAYGLLLAAFGVGAASAAVLRPRLEARLSVDRIVGGATVAVAAALLVVGLVPVPWAVALALVAAGGAFTSSFVTTSVAAQRALPAWVRARGMALYTIVTSGGVGLGSALWGVLATWSLETAFVCAAVTMLAGLGLVRRYRLADPFTLDTTPAPAEAATHALEPEPGDGPVLVTVAYRVPEHEQQAFVALMRKVERARRRTGAYRWGLFRDLAAPDRFLETYVVESWGEHLRQHVRGTATDQANKDAAEHYSEGRVAVAHYVSAYAVHPEDEPAVPGEG